MVVTIYTNEDNPATLKILIAYHFANVKDEFTIEICNPHGKILIHMVSQYSDAILLF